MKRSIALLTVCIFAVVLLLGCQPVNNDAGETQGDVQETMTEWTPEKDIVMICPSAPGTGMDGYSRIVAQQLEKALGVSVVVENITGGGQVTGARVLYNSPADGTMIGMVNIPGTLLQEQLGNADLKVREMTYLGNVGASSQLLVASKQSGIKSVDDLKQPDLKTAIAGMGTISYILTTLMNATFEVEDYTLVPHDSSNEAVLAVIRGDSDQCNFDFGFLYPFVESGDVTPIVVFADERSPLLPDVPTMAEAGYPDLTDAVTLYYGFSAPPNLPEPITKVLRDAMWEAISSDEVKEWIETTNRTYRPIKGEDYQNMVNKIYDEYAGKLDYFKE